MKKSFITLVLLTFSWCYAFSQVDTISSNIYQKYGRLGIGTTNPLTSLSIKSEEDYGGYERIMDLNINGVPDSYLLFRNNTSIDNQFEPCIHGSTSFSERSGLMIMGNIFEDGDNNDNAIINITPFVDNGFGWENGGFDYPSNRHYFRIRGYKSGIGDKYLFEIDQNGNIGIGTKTPNAKLEVTDGDIYINNIESGVIMKSPDGQCWRGTVNNFGNLLFSQIDCPELVAKSPAQPNSVINVNVFPNPANDIINIEIEKNSTKKIKYILFNANGQLIENGFIKSDVHQIDISKLSAGLYTLSIYDKKGNILASKQIVKK